MENKKSKDILEIKDTDAVNSSKLKKDLTKNIESAIITSDKLHKIEPTNTLSSIQISLSILMREINKIN